ncbi:MAG TPA: hypothetical protein VN861_02860 [Candidatus Acidoferrales bacterium]|nr:hypothetical protein [Candidatus Acidoferrales bacterium]
MTKPDTLKSRAAKALAPFYSGVMGGPCDYDLNGTRLDLVRAMADFHRAEQQRLVREIRELADAKQAAYDSKASLDGRVRAEALRELAERIEKEIK